MGTGRRLAGFRTGGLALLAALAPGEGAARGEGEDDEFPGRATLAVLEPKRPFLRNYLLPHGRKAVDAPACRLAKRVAGDNLVFVDLDGNGRFDELGVDGWTVEGGTHVVPLDPVIVVGAFETRLRFSGDGKEVRFKAAPAAGSRDVLEGLALLNELRLRNGLPTVTTDPALSRACEAHARYCNIHGVTHDQVPGNAGWSEEGARAGRASSVGGAASPAAAVATLYCQFYHRLTITDPTTRTIGFGMDGSMFVLDGISGRKSRPWSWPVVIPAPGSVGQPREYDTKESPRPWDGEGDPGFPITVQFLSPETRDVKAELRAGAKGTAVPFFLSWPGTPANDRFKDNFFSICVLPEARLAARTEYPFRVSWVHKGEPGEVSGSFTTGEAGRPAAGKR